MVDTRKGLSKPNPQKSAAWNTLLFSDLHLLTATTMDMFLVISSCQKLTICLSREVLPNCSLMTTINLVAIEMSTMAAN